MLPAAVVGVLAMVVGVVTELVPGVLPPPQAASSTSMPTTATSRQNLVDMLRVYMFFGIIFLGIIFSF
jgi:hypothetical protein